MTTKELERIEIECHAAYRKGGTVAVMDLVAEKYATEVEEAYCEPCNTDTPHITGIGCLCCGQ